MEKSEIHKICLSVCLVESDPLYLDRMRQNLLSRDDVSLDSVMSPADAIEKLGIRVYDLVIIDVLVFQKIVGTLSEHSLETCMYILTTGEKTIAMDKCECWAIACLKKPIMDQPFNRAVDRAVMYYRGIGNRHNFQNADIYNSVNKNNRLLHILQSKNNLKEHHAHLCMLILKGKSKEDLCNLLSITPNTMKTYLREIYAKTIEKDNTYASASKSKLYQLSGYMQKMYEQLGL